MSTHINAPHGAIAEAVLLPGDPLRAKFIADNFLEDAQCYNEVRGMYGFTGTYKGKKVSVQGTGMGQPSLSIYVNELFQFYGVKVAIRIGTAGSISEKAKLRDTLIVSSACSDSALLTQRFGNLHFAPTSDFELLETANSVAKEMNIPHIVGQCVSSDLFYDENENWKLWKKYGVVGVEMEAAELLTLAAKYDRKGLALLTISDDIVTGEATSAEERQTSFTNMMKIALETAIAHI